MSNGKTTEQVEKRRAQQRKYQTVWQKTHPKYQAAYRAANRERIRQRKRTWREAHREKLQADNAAYRAAHPEKAAERRSKYKAMVKGATIGDRKRIEAIYRMRGADEKIRCHLCGKFVPMGEREVDHVFPVSKGGAHTPWNLAIAHVECNRKKRAKLPEEVGLLL